MTMGTRSGVTGDVISVTRLPWAVSTHHSPAPRDPTSVRPSGVPALNRGATGRAPSGCAHTRVGTRPPSSIRVE